MTDEKLEEARALRREVGDLEWKFDRVLDAKNGNAAKISLYIDGLCVCEMLPLELVDVMDRIGKKYEELRLKFGEL
jgi:hypothetical protein